MFTNTQGKGFQMKFANGWAVSVQWGPGNYCDNRNASFRAWSDNPCSESMVESTNAECAVFDPDGAMVNYFDGNETQVNGWMDAADVLALMNEVAAK